MAEKIATRDGFGHELVELGAVNEKIVVVSADLEDATRAEYFKKAFPDRFFTVGIAEQDMVGTACGLSLQGFVPFINSFAVFLTNRAYDQLRIDVCYNDCNVKVICSHAGITVGPDGATAQCLEDLAIMRVLPNMVVCCPADTNEAREMTKIFAKEKGPMYMRTSRAPLPVLTKEGEALKIGKAKILRKGKDVSIIACGLMVSQGLEAAEALEKEGISAQVVNMHTIKPIDEKCIIDCAVSTGAIVTAEEHQINGGLGSAVAEVVVRNAPVPLEMVAVNDTFGQTGSPDELIRHFGLSVEDVIKACRKAVKRKSA